MTRRSFAVALCCLAGVLAFGAGARGADPKPDSSKKLALLVGCSYYKNLPDHLWGPEHDVPLMAGLLENSFGLPKTNVRTLVGWPDDKSARPTAANIRDAFKKLIAAADKDSQVVILLSGHGAQVPIPEVQTDVNDPKNPEPDGLDEVFLPADVEGWSRGELKNGILDDEVGRWLDELRAKGAHVWIIFDCCHSGSMMRGGENQVERQRTVRPEVLGVPKEALAAAAAKAQAAERQRGGPLLEGGGFDISRGKGPGSVVAFYAAQAFEETPEMPRPVGAAQVRENYYGLLTYTLVSVLKQRQSPLNYRELMQIVGSRYRGERQSRGPTPSVEGDVDREVLGATTWQSSGVLLKHKDGKLQLDAGEVFGLTPGSVLAVHPPPGEGKPADVLGFVKVVAVRPLAADVEPCPDPTAADPPVTPADKLPELARCAVVLRDIGDMRLKLAVERADAELAKKDPERAKLIGNLSAAVDQLAAEVKDMIRVVEKEAEADWVLRLEDGKDGPQAVLRPGEGRKVLDPKQTEAERPAVVGQPRTVRSYGGYSAAKPADLAKELNRDLQKLFKWQNLWRVAGTLGQEGQAASEGQDGVKLQLVELTGEKGKEIGPLEKSSVPAGQWVRVRVVNKGDEPYWVVVLALSGDFSIQTLFADSVAKKGNRYRDINITGDTLGPEGIVVLVWPQPGNQEGPNFDFLNQTALKEVTKAVDLPKVPNTPFGKLMAASSFGGKTRKIEASSPDTPAILSWTWVTVPAPPRP
jgi:hypothetical protein